MGAAPSCAPRRYSDRRITGSAPAYASRESRAGSLANASRARLRAREDHPGSSGHPLMINTPNPGPRWAKSGFVRGSGRLRLMPNKHREWSGDGLH